MRNAESGMRSGRGTKILRTQYLVLSSLAVFALWFAQAAAAQSSTVAPLLKLLESGRVPAERQAAILEMICTRGEAADLAVVVKFLGRPDALSASSRRKVIELLTDAARTRKIKPAGDLSALAGLIEGEAAAQDPALMQAAIRLAAAWQVQQVAPALRQLAVADSGDPAIAQTALEALVSLGGNESQATALQVARLGRTIPLRASAVASLAKLDPDAAAAAATDVLAAAGPQDDIAPMLDALLSRQAGADKLAAALAGQPLPADAAKLALRHIYSLGRSDQALSDILSKAAGIALDAPPPTPEEALQIAARVALEGDAARGERIFRRADLSCLKCHSVAQAGGTVGPELSAIGSISPTDYIVNSILNPNLAIKEQFVTRRVLTLDGDVLTGIQIDRDDQRLRLKDAAGTTHVIPIDDIEQEGEGQSLMPQGLTKFLTEQELLDLARFVSELGKPGAYAIRRTPSIQRWRVLKDPPPELTAEVPNVEMFRELVLDAPAESWATAYGQVSGSLPLAELAPVRPAVLYVQGQIDVSAAGPIAVEIASTEPTHVWIDAEPFDAPTKIERQLAAGKHTVTIRVALSAAAHPELKVELTKPPNSPAQFVVVNGM